MRVWGAECKFFLIYRVWLLAKALVLFICRFFYELCQVLVSFACPIAKPSVRALKTKLK